MPHAADNVPLHIFPSELEDVVQLPTEEIFRGMVLFNVVRSFQMSRVVYRRYYFPSINNN